tara:strand:- start:121 stop:537 length:417 start_codon:yes stop_codon:yes gene_type:complete
MISFTVKGTPRALKRHRSTRTGRMYDPSARDKKELWLQIAKYKPKRPFAGDVMIKMLFTMPHPKSHYRTGRYKHLLKSQFEELTFHSFKPDLDNLVKLVLDTIGKNRMIVDDSQICRLQAEKIYGKHGSTEVYIEEIS